MNTNQKQKYEKKAKTKRIIKDKKYQHTYTEQDMLALPEHLNHSRFSDYPGFSFKFCFPGCLFQCLYLSPIFVFGLAVLLTL